MTRAPSIVALMGSRSLFGAERANIDLLRMMQETGARVTCIVRDEDWPENIKIRQFLDGHGLDWRTCPFASYPTWRYWRYWPSVIRENFRAITDGNRGIKQICEAVEATHIHSFNPFLTFSFFPALNALALPLIYRCGERPVDHNLIFRLIWAWLRRRIRHIGTESKYVRDLLVEKGFGLETISVIPTPPPRRRLESLSCNFIYTTQQYNGNIFRFCFIGQITDFKGVKVLLDSFGKCFDIFPNSSLFIAGAVNDDWARRLEIESRGRFPEGAVRFLGHVEDVHTLLKECDVLIAPSLEPEGYGLVAVEAKQAARPSIVFAGGGLGELVEDQVDGIVVQEKTDEALAEAMLTYCRSPERARADGDRAKASLTERLATHLYAERWRAIYDKSMPDLGSLPAKPDTRRDQA